MVAVIVASSLAVGAHRWTHPSLFVDGDVGGISMDAQPVSKFPVYVGFGHVDGGSPETLTVDAVTVRLSGNSAAFTVKVLVCTQRPVAMGTLTLGVIFADEDELSEYCTSVRPVDLGTRVSRKKRSGDYFVAALTPSRAGSAHVDAIDIRYARGARHFFQRGTQHVEQDIALAAKP